MSDWKPPAFGTPVWMGIPAKDVTRASEFYKVVFDFSFAEATEKHPQDQLMKFDFSPSLGLSGGIQKAPDRTGNFAPGKGGVCIYWYVENVDTIGPIIEKAGGKMLSEKEKEGEHGLYRFFEDTEGSVGAVYQMA
ncbi:glyoxalaselike domain-containing [Fusarium sporotrichioides]|uniref:Glyoxalaselike domain-containing n=1 Tax=Fusarium sporotrichioides TaxID=5514 RepID=A0A395RX81_FUSSP|nr:glyoxalaselike domain-containing [Fusarium sporotrichioides]